MNTFYKIPKSCLYTFPDSMNNSIILLWIKLTSSQSIRESNEICTYPDADDHNLLYFIIIIFRQRCNIQKYKKKLDKKYKREVVIEKMCGNWKDPGEIW